MTIVYTTAGLAKGDKGDAKGAWATQIWNPTMDIIDDVLVAKATGNPNGLKAGIFVGQFVMDSTAWRPYNCTTTGTATSAVWAQKVPALTASNTFTSYQTFQDGVTLATNSQFSGQNTFSGRNIYSKGNQGTPFSASGLSGAYTLDFSRGCNFKLGLAANITLTATNAYEGQSGVIEFYHETLAREITLTAIETSQQAGLSLSTIGGARDLIGYYVRSDGIVCMGFPLLAVG